MQPVFATPPENSIDYASAVNSVVLAFNEINQIAYSNAGVESVISGIGSVNIEWANAGDGNGWSASDTAMEIDYTATSGLQVDSFGSGNQGINQSFNRAIFHELFHAASIASPEEQATYALSANSLINLSEESAVFAENLLFAPVEGSGVREGHSLWSTSAKSYGGISGLDAFTWIQSSEGPIFEKTASGISFTETSDDGLTGVYKTYRPNFSADGFDYSNYIDVSSFNQNGIFDRSKATPTLTSGASMVAKTLMGAGSTVGTEIASAITTIQTYGLIITAGFNQTEVVGLSGERFYERESPKNAPHNMYDFDGVGYQIYAADGSGKIGSAVSPGIIKIDASNHHDGVLLIGAGGGNSAYSVNSADHLIGGEGSDILISTAYVAGHNHLEGGSGDDILIGSGGVGDILDGGSGADLLIARGTESTYNGGGGGDIDVLSYLDFGTFNPVSADTNTGTVTHNGAADSYTGIAVLIGTNGADTFQLGGSVALFGGDGNDTFVGVPTGAIHGGDGIDTLDLSHTGGADIDLNSWNLDSIENFIGSDQADYFRSGFIHDGQTNVDAKISSGAGDDEIWVASNLIVDAGADDDIVHMLTGDYNSVVGGDGFDTLDLSALMGPLSVDIDQGTYRIGTQGALMNFSGFEKFEFGSATLTLHGSGTFSGGTGINTIYGSSGMDVITAHGTGGNVYGGAGDDTIYANGKEYVWGEQGDDTIRAGDQGAYMFGGIAPASATLSGFDGNDHLFGGAGIDYLNGGTGTNDLHGGAGYDYFSSNGYGDNTVYGDADGGMMSYSFNGHGGSPADPDLISIHNMGDHFDVITTPNHGQTLHTDHLYGIDKVSFVDTSYMLTPALSVDTHYYGF